MATSARRLLHYPTPEDRYDEIWDGPEPRPHWRAFLSQIGSLSEDALRDRERFVRKAIASDGVTYNIHADRHGAGRPWELDVLPLILPASEWRTLAAGVAQRARLLDRVLADVYGPQHLIREGLLPPALVFGQLGYLWPACGVVPEGGTFLHVYAADVARAPDGKFWVIGDRTQGPAGAAYALQNRATLARAFPDAFRDLKVEPLQAFFSALQDSIARLSPTRGEPPLSVVLTPGPYNETYFEHVFLARHLGFPLVEGQDLIVRQDAVYLKTLRGLRRVHAILRRLDDDYCDPVELRADSALGVPGLLAAARAGNVLLANALGSGILESGALHGFFPALCERLFGETLALPALATWWCGEAPALEYAKKRMGELVIKAAYPSMRMEPVFGHTLDADGRAKMIERMSAQPHAYVAQEWVHLSRAPARVPGEGTAFEGRSIAMRVFAVATPDGYKVMPGALTRVAPDDGDIVSLHGGGASKDTWVLSDGPAPVTAPLRRRVAISDVLQGRVQIPSRVGENLFWLGRYSERCEAIARLLRAALIRLSDAAPASRAPLRSIAEVCEALGVLPGRLPVSSRHGGRVGATGTAIDDELTADFMAAVADPGCPGGLAANLSRLCNAGAHVRERMSTDNWHVLGRLGQRISSERPAIGEALEALDDVMLACVSLAGFAMDDMTRDESWRFLLLGRRLERLLHLAGVAGVLLGLPSEAREDSLEWLLEAANSIVTFRARYRTSPELLPVIHLVVLDASNPHAVMFQLQDLLRHLDSSAEELGTGMPDDDLRRVELELARIDLTAFEATGLTGSSRPPGDEAHRSSPQHKSQSDACKALSELLSQVRMAGFSLSDALHRRFFSHAGTPAPTGL
ncbi:MAG: circularly permuted type 2 ATP-grasp protein [Polyangiaceae bacterium]